MQNKSEKYSDVENLPKNLKFLREGFGLLQEELADKIGVSRDNITSYERGTTPKLPTLLRLVNFFQITVEEISTQPLFKSCTFERDDKNNVHLIRTPNSTPNSKSKQLGVQMSRSYDGDTREVYLLDTKAAAATFQAGYFGPDNPATLSILQIPSQMLERSRMHYALRVTDHSMKPTIYNGDIVVCFQVQPNEIKDNLIYVVSERDRGVLVKRLLNRLSERGTIRARSDNPDESPFEIQEEDIIAVFQVKFKISFYMPNESEGIQKSMLELRERIETIELALKK